MKTFLPLVICLLSAALPGRADIAFTLDNSTLFGGPGDTITFTGSMFNNGAQTVFLNGLNLSPGDPGLTGDSTPFFSGPASLDPGMGSGSIPLFTISIANPFLAGNGSYPGSYTLVGGQDGNAMDSLATGTFTVMVAPEPSADCLMLLGAAGLVALRRWTK